MAAVGVVLRCDASPTVGLGHWARCRAIADAVAAGGGTARWATRGGATLAALDASAAVEPLPSDIDAPFASDLAAIDPPPAGWIVVDHYGANDADLAALQRGGARVAVFDDHQQRRADLRILLAGVPGDRSAMLAGLAYAPLRPAFRLARLSRTVSDGGVVLMFGGADPGRLSSAVIASLRRTAWASHPLTVIASDPVAAAQDLDAALAAWPGGGRRWYGMPPSAIAALLRSAESVVCACSTSALEALAVGAPTVAVCSLDNQRALGRALTAAGVVVVECPTAAVAAMPGVASPFIDGLGAERIVAALGLAIAPSMPPPAGPLAIRTATEADCAEVWAINTHVATRRESLSPRPIPWSDHLAWWRSRPPDLLVASLGGMVVGCMRVRDGWVDIAVHPVAQRRGVASALLRASAAAGGRRAIISAGNDASLALFAKAGYHDDGPDDHAGFRRLIQSGPNR